MTARWDPKQVKEILHKEGYVLLSNYKNIHSKLISVCPNQHLYEFVWASFMQGHRCGECAGSAPKRIGYIKKVIEKEGYTLLSSYKNTHSKIKILCPNGHEWITSWGNFQQGHRCGICNGNAKKNINEIREYLKQYNYNLLSTEYESSQKILTAKCPNGHEYKFCWNSFQRGARCPCESNLMPVTIEHLTQCLKNENYNLISDIYVNPHTKLIATCPQGHMYEFTWGNFKQGYRCNKCFCTKNRSEKDLASMLQKCNPLENDRSTIYPLELDLYFPKQNIAIEFCGLYWHSDAHERMVPSYHRKKLDLCTEKGVRLITIFEDEWRDHKDICLSRINNALGVIENKIYARNCEVKEINNQEAYEFLNKTHLQGAGRCKIAFGLFYNDKLVQVMTFGSPTRAHTAKGKRVLEMKRLASGTGLIVVGGAGKLFEHGKKYAIDNTYETIKSYCDLRWGTGNLYAKLGFTKTHETKYTPHYTDKYRRFRNQYMATNQVKENKTETDKVKECSLFKIYDCGHQTWEYRIGV